MESDVMGFVRTSFEDGMLLSAADLQNLQAYFDGKRRLLNRGLLGRGVVFGLTVEKARDGVWLHSGFAVDDLGREIYLSKKTFVLTESLFEEAPETGTFFLCLEYGEEPCGEAFSMKSDGTCGRTYNRIKETFRLKPRRSREDGDICVATVVVDAAAFEAGYEKPRITSVTSPVDAFTFAPVAGNVPSRQNSGTIYIGEHDSPGSDGVFRTREISHGLGAKKDVMIELSVKGRDGLRDCEVFGDPRLFGGNILLAAKLFPESGSFVIAVKNAAPATGPICVRWRAYSL